jgi:hypothetical protein
MGFFNFIETFFFISLGITFVLILLLVYHFKQRISSLEIKFDSVVEIINNIMKELTILRNTQMNMYSFSNGYRPTETVISVSKENQPKENQPKENQPEEKHPEKIHVVLSESDYDDSDDDSDDVDSDDDSSSMPELEEIHDISDSTEVKIINLDIENIIIDDSDIQYEEIDPIEDFVEPMESVLEPLDPPIQEPIHVEKIESLEQSYNEESKSIVENKIDVYRKMNLQTLKTFVISHGLCSDPSKMKKVELLKLIETDGLSIE